LIHCFYCRRPENSLHDLDCPHNTPRDVGVEQRHTKKAGFLRHLVGKVRGYPVPNLYDKLAPGESEP